MTWTAVVLAAVGAAAGLSAVGLPGAWLIGPLLAGIVVGVGGLAELAVPRVFFLAAQAAIGTLIAGSFTPPVVAQIVREGFVMLAVVATTIAAAAVAGWLLARFGTLSASTAAWGSSPGGAAAMTAMSAEFGADPRLVAFMQYLRVTIVVLSAGTVARLLLPRGVHVSLPGTVALDPLAFAETLAVALAGVLVARRLRVPSAPLFGPMVLGAVLHGMGIVRIAVPTQALQGAYVAIGLTIGLSYTRATLRFAVRALPELLLSTGVLIALCALSGVLLATAAHVDALTAYLATTPGGLDSVTAIALGSGANVPLVLAVQALRVFAVILSGPPLAKLIARVAEKGNA